MEGDLDLYGDLEDPFFPVEPEDAPDQRDEEVGAA